jgi:hypothetical protein
MPFGIVNVFDVGLSSSSSITTPAEAELPGAMLMLFILTKSADSPLARIVKTGDSFGFLDAITCPP